MKLEEVKSLFSLAGIEVLNLWELPNGYLLKPSDRATRYTTSDDYNKGVVLDVMFADARPWWLVKTRQGLIQIGWRKRVINIDWSDTPIRAIVTKDDVTKDETMVHAWTMLKAAEYLTALASLLRDYKTPTAVNS